MEEKYVIVRADRAGVFAGVLKSKKGSEVVLTSCRKLWYWSGASAVEQLAVDGVAYPNECKFTIEVDSICILGVIQILPTTKKSEESIKSVEPWKQ